MRIGLFTDQYYPNVSGVVTSIKMLYEGLTELGHECIIFTSGDENAIGASAESRTKNIVNFSGRPYPFKDLRDYRYTLTHGRFVETVARYNLDILHVHTEFNVAKIAIKAAKKLHIPAVYTMHTTWSEMLKYLFPRADKLLHAPMFRLFTRLFTKPICRCASVHIVPTEKALIAAEPCGVGKGRGKKVCVIPTGIDLGKFLSPPESGEVSELKRALGIDGKFVFVYVGRVSEEKNLIRLLRAFAKAFGACGDTRLLIVGGGPDEAALKREAERLGVSHKTIFVGLVPWERVPLYYRAGDVFVNASQAETQGLTYIEALASSIPVLAARDECIRDVVTDGLNGVIFDGEDDLANKMQMLYSSPDFVAELSGNAPQSVEGFSKKAYAAKVHEAYKYANGG